MYPIFDLRLVKRKMAGIGHVALNTSFAYQNLYMSNCLVKSGFRDYKFKNQLTTTIPGRIFNKLITRTQFLDLYTGNSSLYHSFETFSPKTKLPIIITAHDFAFLYNENFHKQKIDSQFMKNIQESLNKASAVIAISKTTKNDLLKNFNIEKNKIHVVYNGCTIQDSPIERDTNFDYVGSYILFIGTIEPRKNLLRILKAYKNLRQRKLIREKLIIAGQFGWSVSDEEKKEIENFFLRDDIFYVGYVDQNLKRNLLKRASMLVYISLYEGFGLPVLEALSYGKATLVSNSSALGEIYSKISETCNPKSVSDISTGILKVLNSNEIKKNNFLESERIKFSKEFSWKKTAIEVRKVHQLILS